LFAAILDTDGRPIDRRALARPGLIVDGPSDTPGLAFVHAPRPAAGDWCGVAFLGACCLAGRFRLDARAELRARLSGPFAAESDGALCLRAHAAWGDDFVQHLSGDFAFVLWDGERRRLLAVRDRLGVRALFHAAAGGAVFVSDSLDWIASAAPIDRALDDRWIADFLTVGHCLDFERTVWRDVKRVAPAHRLDLSAAGATPRRYWTLQLDEPLYLRRAADYGERFVELMIPAIRDRLPAGRVGVSMSGGLDSTTLAACTVMAAGDPARVVAECTHFERLMPDEEKHYSALAARHLGIEIVHTAVDDLTYDPGWRTRSIDSDEPHVGAIAAEPERRMSLGQAALAPVWFFGEGPDNALVFERDAYLAWLLRRRDWRRLGEAALLYLGSKDGWAETLRRYAGPRPPSAGFAGLPPWLARDLDARLPKPPESAHPWHPLAMASFADPIWSALFSGFDDDERQAPFVWRHPYLDLRVLEFLLSVPPVPWARRKLLLRQAMRGRLPREVLERRKAPLADAPHAHPVRTLGLPVLARDPRLARYVDFGALPDAAASGPLLDRLIAVHALDYWLARHP